MEKLLINRWEQVSLQMVEGGIPKPTLIEPRLINPCFISKISNQVYREQIGGGNIRDFIGTTNMILDSINNFPCYLAVLTYLTIRQHRVVGKLAAGVGELLNTYPELSLCSDYFNGNKVHVIPFSHGVNVDMYGYYKNPEVQICESLFALVHQSFLEWKIVFECLSIASGTKNLTTTNSDKLIS